MNYQESFAQALKLKDFVTLYDDKAYINLIFSTPTEFKVTVLDHIPDEDARFDMQHHAVHVNKLPLVTLKHCEYYNAKVYSYHEPEFSLHIDIDAGKILYFQSIECDLLDLEIHRKEAIGSYNHLITKLK